MLKFHDWTLGLGGLRSPVPRKIWIGRWNRRVRQFSTWLTMHAFDWPKDSTLHITNLANIRTLQVGGTEQKASITGRTLIDRTGATRHLNSYIDTSVIRAYRLGPIQVIPKWNVTQSWFKSQRHIRPSVYGDLRLLRSTISTFQVQYVLVSGERTTAQTRVWYSVLSSQRENHQAGH